MESKCGGKIQRKRARSTAKPYSRATTSSTRETGSSSGHRSGVDANQSLFQRVSSSLLGFVTPSWLTSYWTSSQEKDKAVPKTDQPAKQDADKPSWPLPTEQIDGVDAEDQLQDDEDADMEGVAVTQTAETKGTPFSSQQPLGTSTPVDDFNNRFKVCTDDGSDVSIATSSVSMIPQVDNTEYQDKLPRSNLTKLDERTSAKPWTNTASSRLASRPQPPGRNLHKPTFNSSYFGSPVSGRESPVGPFASPFYPGRTTYGGASAQRSPYQVYHPIRRRVKPKQASSSINSGFGVTSAAAKQILETLEKMSTPLSDAKKIPLSPTASPLVFNPSKRARTAFKPGPPVAPRPVPTHMSVASTSRASLLAEESERPRKLPTIHKEPEVVTPSTAKFSVQSTFKFGVPNNIPGTPASTSISDVHNSGSGGGGKMKSKRKSAVHISKKEDDQIEMLEEPDLPNIPLPLAKGKMPSFFFGLSTTATSTSPSTKLITSTVTSTSSTKLITSTATSTSPISKLFTSTVTSISPSTRLITSTATSTSPSSKLIISKPGTMSKPAVQFKFSPPIFKEGLPVASESGVAKPFTFSDPKPAAAAASSSFTSPMMKPKETNTVQEEESFGGGLRPAKELKKGSCLEVLGIIPSKSGTKTSGNNKKPIIGFGDKFKKEPGTWKCSDCLLDNKPDAKTCIACRAAKPKASNESNRIGLKQDNVDPAQKSSISLSQSRTLASSKTSTTHLHSSNRSQTSSPQIGFGDKFKQSQTSSPQIGFGDKFKPEPGSWNCSDCLLENKPGAKTCIACMAAKPKASNDSMFKPEQGSWNCNDCLLNNKPDRDTCIACTSPRPQTTNSIQPKISLAEKFKPAKGSWTCDTCFIVNKEDVLRCVACTAAKPATTSQSSSLRVSKPGNTKPSISISSNADLSRLKSPPSTCLDFLNSSKSSTSKCVASHSDRPTTAQSEQSSASLREKFAPPAGSWSCDTCLIQNKSSETKCVACGSAKPVSKPETKSTFGFGDKFKAQPGSWTCDTCLIQNQKSISKCLACGANQPGSEPSLKAPPASAFKFGGVINQSSSTGNVSTFKFGGTAPPSTGGFSFGGSEQSNPTTGGFTLGKPSSVNTISAISETSSKTTDSGNQERKNSEMSTFQFVKSSSSESQNRAFGQKSEKAPAVSGGFSFGQNSATNSTEKSENSTLSTGEGRGSAVGFRFGNAASTAAKTDSSSSSSTFVFGAKSNQTNDLTKSDGFQLGNGSEKGITKEASSSAFQLSTGSANIGFSFGSKNSSTVDSKDSGSVFGGTNKLVLGGNAAVNNNDVKKPATGIAFPFGAAAATETKSPATFVFSGQPKEASETKPSATFTFGKNKSSGQDEAGIGASTPAKVGGFSFGNPSNEKAQEPAATTNTSLPAFSFGSKSSAPAANAEPPTFKFGQNNPNPTPPAFGGFGAANNSMAPAPGNSVNSSTSGFNFNSGSNTSSGSGGGFSFNSSSKPFDSGSAPKFGATSSTPNFGATVNPIAPVPTFGGQSSSMIGGSGFGVGNSNSVPFGGTGANNQPVPAFGSTAPQTNGPGFQFNSSSNTKSSNSFQFGQQNNSAPVFKFGANNPERSSATPPPSSTFNFGSTPAAQPNNFGGFANPGNQFNAAANDNPFNAVSSGATVQGRRIKKAQRRIKKP